MNISVNLVWLADQPRHFVLCRHKGEYALFLAVPTPLGEKGCCPDCGHDAFTRMHEWLECDSCGFGIQNDHLKQWITPKG